MGAPPGALPGAPPRRATRRPTPTAGGRPERAAGAVIIDVAAGAAEASQLVLAHRLGVERYAMILTNEIAPRITHDELAFIARQPAFPCGGSAKAASVGMATANI